MANILIRTYENRDYDVVLEIFARGIMDYLPSTSMYLLGLHQVHVIILVSFIIFYLVFSSFLVSLLGVVALLAGARLLLEFVFHKIIKKAHKLDLQNIEESYMSGQNSCFWVAEVNGRVVGMVGVKPVQGSPHEVELRRLSVAKEHRHKGIARRLCMHVIDYAHQRGYEHVTLNTSTIQHAAHKLYLKLGFRKTKSKPVSDPFGRLVDVTVTYYTYDIKA
ncbi:probable N-acetyltransferase camello isoform X2 [Bufo gargarizans]|nr:probable N-acetyltransferase camello isoform X2 [Bufo gargarizans]XP_044145229.1 probable N-acetyltransferase camello isoform X2 [Bufo gargarizans]